MFTVRAFDRQTGDLEQPRFRADEVTEKTRRSLADLYNYTCLGCDTAHYHWRKKTRRNGNTETLRETFVRNRGTQHEDGCAYDYFEFARDNPDNVYIKDGLLHIRINFPLGNAYKDLYPPRKDFEVPQHYGSAPKIKKEPIDSLRKLVDLLEKRFGSLEDHALEDVLLDYQGQTYHWQDLFVPSDRYARVYKACHEKSPDDRESHPVFVVVKPLSEIAPNAAGKRRFVCEAQYASTDKHKNLEVKPILVCDDDETSTHIRRIIERRKNGWNKDEVQAGLDTVMVAARPYVLDAHRHSQVNAYLTIMHQSQIARLPTKQYWRLIPGKRHQLSIFDQPGISG